MALAGHTAESVIIGTYDRAPAVCAGRRFDKGFIHRGRDMLGRVSGAGLRQESPESMVSLDGLIVPEQNIWCKESHGVSPLLVGEVCLWLHSNQTITLQAIPYFPLFLNNA